MPPRTGLGWFSSLDLQRFRPYGADGLRDFTGIKKARRRNLFEVEGIYDELFPG